MPTFHPPPPGARPFAPRNAAELHAFSELPRSDRPAVAALAKKGHRPAFRPVDTGGLNWTGALRELRKTDGAA
jgi:hypothetical protein